MQSLNLVIHSTLCLLLGLTACSDPAAPKETPAEAENENVLPSEDTGLRPEATLFKTTKEVAAADQWAEGSAERKLFEKLENAGLDRDEALLGMDVLLRSKMHLEKTKLEPWRIEQMLEWSALSMGAGGGGVGAFSAQLDRGLIGIIRTHNGADDKLDAVVWVNSFTTGVVAQTVEHWIVANSETPPYPLEMDGTMNMLRLDRLDSSTPRFQSICPAYHGHTDLSAGGDPAHVRVQLCLHPGQLSSPPAMSPEVKVTSTGASLADVTIKSGAIQFTERGLPNNVVAILQVNTVQVSGADQKNAFTELWIVPAGTKPPLAPSLDAIFLDATRRDWGTFVTDHGPKINGNKAFYTGVGFARQILGLNANDEKSPVPRQYCE